MSGVLAMPESESKGRERCRHHQTEGEIVPSLRLDGAGIPARRSLNKIGEWSLSCPKPKQAVADKAQHPATLFTHYYTSGHTPPAPANCLPSPNLAKRYTLQSNDLSKNATIRLVPNNKEKR